MQRRLAQSFWLIAILSTWLLSCQDHDENCDVVEHQLQLIIDDYVATSPRFVVAYNYDTEEFYRNTGMVVVVENKLAPFDLYWRAVGDVCDTVIQSDSVTYSRHDCEIDPSHLTYDSTVVGLVIPIDPFKEGFVQKGNWVWRNQYTEQISGVLTITEPFGAGPNTGYIVHYYCGRLCTHMAVYFFSLDDPLSIAHVCRPK